MPGLVRPPESVLLAPLDDVEDVGGAEAELGEVGDPLGLQRLGVRVGRRLELAPGHVASDHESVPGTA